MTRKKIYLHTSNLEHITDLRWDPDFESLPDYALSEYMKLHRNEYGRIKTKKNNYHILVGRIRDDGCPWCGCPPELKEVKDRNNCPISPRIKIKYFMECPKCLSRGPTLNLNDVRWHDQPFEEWVKERVKYAYSDRLPWDHKFNEEESE